MKHDIKKTTLNSQTIERQNQCIETDRLLLRKPKKEDAEPMFKNWASDEEVTKYMTWISHENIEVRT